MNTCDVKSGQLHCTLHYRYKKQIKLIGRSKVQYLPIEVSLQEKTYKVKMYDLLLNSLWPTEKYTDEKTKT